MRLALTGRFPLVKEMNGNENNWTSKTGDRLSRKIANQTKSKVKEYSDYPGLCWRFYSRRIITDMYCHRRFIRVSTTRDWVRGEGTETDRHWRHNTREAASQTHGNRYLICIGLLSRLIAILLTRWQQASRRQTYAELVCAGEQTQRNHSPPNAAQHSVSNSTMSSRHVILGTFVCHLKKIFASLLVLIRRDWSTYLGCTQKYTYWTTESSPQIGLATYYGQ